MSDHACRKQATQGDARTHACGLDRRAFLTGAASALAASTVGLPTRVAKAAAAPSDKKYGMPGPYPGRVIEVGHPGSVVNGEFRREPVDAMIARGMAELTGADDAVSAWRSMFSPGDVVGVKVNPVGVPLAISNYVTVHAIIDGLRSAGVKPKDIIVFTRYESLWRQAKYEQNLPEGVRSETAVAKYDATQLDIKGYDPDVFCEMAFIDKVRHDPKDERTRRSHLCETVSKRINKMVTIPLLKDHRAAGVTGALKNMSHGLANNVARSHSSPDTNTTNVFIPTVCAMEQIRQKAVLHIMDALVGVYEKGPHTSRKNAAFVWPYKGMFFATDPVAMDSVEWRIIDAKRAEMKLPPVAKTGRVGMDPRGEEDFDIRQPQHIVLAGALGLGVDDHDKIEHRKVSLT